MAKANDNDNADDNDDGFFMSNEVIYEISQKIDITSKANVDRHLPIVPGRGTRFPPTYISGVDSWKEVVKNITHFQILSAVEQAYMCPVCTQCSNFQTLMSN